jgi:hypothetical protein
MQVKRSPDGGSTLDGQTAEVDEFAHEWPEEPTAAELAAIEREMPSIEAELAVVDAQIERLSAGTWVGPLHHRRQRRATRRLLAVRAELAGPDLGSVA